jgi:hypothetical protein
VEICNGQDDNCDTVIPGSEMDVDLDGVPPCAGDCADTNNTVLPGAPEACDGIDSDCDGFVPPDEVDSDGDGWRGCEGDCAPFDAVIYPLATEACDLLDSDCNGVIPDDEIDHDGDGLAECEGDCGPTDELTLPGAVEICDAIDNDCDGVVPADEANADGDPAPVCANDCDDADPLRYPGSDELCDGIDNDCDGYAMPDEVDVDGDGFMECEGDCLDSDPAINPSAADDPGVVGEDDDCDGAVDNPAPTAVAAVEGDIWVCTPVQLHGWDSTHPQNAELSYAWELISMPPSTELTADAIEPADEVEASFTPDVVGVFVAEVEVWSGNSESDFDAVVLNVVPRPVNSPPVVDLGPDQDAALTTSCYFDAYGSPVCSPPCSFEFELDASGTSDADYDPLAFTWEILSGTGALSSTSDDTTTLTLSLAPTAIGVPVSEIVEVAVSVEDCAGAAVVDEITVTAECVGE